MASVKGTIAEIKTREDASGDIVVTVKLNVFGDYQGLYEYLKKPLEITFKEDHV